MDRPSRGNRGTIILIIVIAVVAGMGTCAYIGFNRYGTPPPDYPRLSDAPDPALHGTVAYLDGPTNCVRAVAASGSTSKEIYCIDPKDGIEGPALRWLPDGRLEMIAYMWPPEEPIRALWRRIIDVETLSIEEASLEGVGDDPLPAEEPPASPDGARVVATFEGGNVLITVDDGTTTRTIMSASGNPEYRLFGQPMWSGDYQWLLVNDGRLLVVMADGENVRILVEEAASLLSSGVISWALIADDLLG